MPIDWWISFATFRSPREVPRRMPDRTRDEHDAIVRLNRNQACPALWFYADGCGQGVCWKPTARPVTSASPDRHRRRT